MRQFQLEPLYEPDQGRVSNIPKPIPRFPPLRSLGGFARNKRALKNDKPGPEPVVLVAVGLISAKRLGPGRFDVLDF